MFRVHKADRRCRCCTATVKRGRIDQRWCSAVWISGTEHAATMSGATAKWAARWVGHGEVSSNFMAVSRVAS